MLIQPGMSSTALTYYCKFPVSFSKCKVQLFNFVITNKSMYPNIDLKKLITQTTGKNELVDMKTKENIAA